MINIIDLAGNTNSYDSDNTVEFDKTIKALNPVTIISNNTVRRMDSGTEKHHYAKLNDNITLEFTSDETIRQDRLERKAIPIIALYLNFGLDGICKTQLA